MSLTEKHHLSRFQFFGNLIKHCRGLYDTQSQKIFLKVLKGEIQWLKPMLIKNIFQKVFITVMIYFVVTNKL